MNTIARRLVSGAVALGTSGALLVGGSASANAQVPTTTSQVTAAVGVTSQAVATRGVSREYANALRAAKTYLRIMPFSKKGLYQQLTSRYGNRFSKAAGNYAVNHVGANWRQQAVRAGRQYLNMGLSREAVRQQLKSPYGEQFTKAEADYALRHLPR